MNSKVIKILGIISTLGAAGCSILSAFVDDKKQDEKIKDEVHKAVINMQEEES